MTDEEMLELAVLAGAVYRPELYNKYTILKCKLNNNGYYNQNINDRYDVIHNLTYRKVPHDEILSMSHEQRLTYIHLFGSDT